MVMDRIDRGWMRELLAERKAERKVELENAGPLLDQDHRKQLERILAEDCKIGKNNAAHVIDTINGCAGADDASPKYVIKNSLDGLVTNEAFKEKISGVMLKIVDKAIEQREERITAAKMQPDAAPQPSVKNKGPKAPS